MHRPLSLAALLISIGCVPEPAPLRAPEPDATIQTLILVLWEPGTEPIVRVGTPGSDALSFRYQLGDDSRSLELFAFGYQCPSLPGLGLEEVGDQLSMVEAGPIRRPDFLRRSSFRDGSQDPWQEPLDGIPEDLLTAGGWQFAPESPCVQLVAEPIESLRVNEEMVGITLALDQDQVLVGSGLLGLHVIHTDGSIRELSAHVATSSETAPGGAALLDAKDELWLYDSGRLWHGPKDGGLFDPEASNPDWLDCPSDPAEFGELGRQYALAAAITASEGPAILVAGNGGSLARFDLESHTWRDPPLIEPSSPVMDRCPFSRTGVLWIGPGQGVAFHQRRNEVALFDESTGDIALEEVRGICHLDYRPELGLFAGTASGEVRRRGGTNDWPVYTGDAGLESIRVTEPFRTGLLFGGQSGRLSQFYPEYGVCATPATQGLSSIERMAPLGDGFVTAPLFDPTETRLFHRLRLVDRGVCAPHLP